IHDNHVFFKLQTRLVCMAENSNVRSSCSCLSSEMIQSHGYKIMMSMCHKNLVRLHLYFHFRRKLTKEVIVSGYHVGRASASILNFPLSSFNITCMKEKVYRFLLFQNLLEIRMYFMSITYYQDFLFFHLLSLLFPLLLHLPEPSSPVADFIFLFRRKLCRSASVLRQVKDRIIAESVFTFDFIADSALDYTKCCLLLSIRKDCCNRTYKPCAPLFIRHTLHTS